MDTLIRDLRYALRALARSPGFTLVAVLSLALGIGANTAIFSVLDRVLLRPLPVLEPERLVRLKTAREDGSINHNLSYPTYAAIRDRTRAFTGVLAYSPHELGFDAGGEAELLRGEFVSADYFDVLGVAPVHGRAFVPEDERDRADVVVLSNGLWQTRFGGSPAVLGRTVRLNTRPFTVIGVAPPGFHGLTRGTSATYWAPLTSVAHVGGGDRLAAPASSWLYVFARLAPGVDAARAQAALSVLDPPLRDAGLRGTGERTVIEPGGHGLTTGVAAFADPLLVMMIAVAILLLIACANVAALLLARAGARSGEVVLRLSLGASRARLVRLLLTESFVLSLAGAAAGLVIALWLGELLLAFRPATGETLQLEDGIGLRVLGFTLVISVATALLFGLAPALRATRLDLAGALRVGAPTSSSGRRRRPGLRNGLVVAQIALSLVLLSAAGLFLRSLQNLRAVDVGFDPDNVLLLRVDLDAAGHDPARGHAFYDRVAERVRGLPGVRAAAWSATVHPHPYGSRWGGFRLDAYTPAPGEEIEFDVNVVSAGYFETLELPILRGRAFDARDVREAPAVAVINDAMAARYWPGRDPVGLRFRGDADDAGIEIVGVVPSGKYRALREPVTMTVYMPAAQEYRPWMTLAVRMVSEPTAIAAAVMGLMREVDPAVPVTDVRTLERHVAMAYGQEAMVATLGTLFAALALALAAIGLYGVLAWLVARRTREIGVRMALGARQVDVIRLVLRGALVLVAAGLALGLPAAILGGRLAAGLLYGVPPGDALTLVAAGALLTLTAAVAAVVPARRAARLDPSAALRTE